jgi:hypothetical protein
MFAEDLTVFFNPADFADAAVYDGAVTVNGNFSQAYADSLGLAGTNPVFSCAAGSVPAAGVGKTLVVRSVTYKIRNRMPQGDGAWVLLELERQ